MYEVVNIEMVKVPEFLALVNQRILHKFVSRF